MGIDEDADWARLASAIVYFSLGSFFTLFGFIKYRHNLRNKLHAYVLRYRKYINSIIILGFAGIFLSVAVAVSLINQGETKRPEDGVESQFGWWSAFALYNFLVLIILGNYHHLTVLGYLFAGFLGLLSGGCMVMLSLSGTNNGWILWSVVGGALLSVSHLFVWLRSQRTYVLIPYGPFGGTSVGLMDASNGHNVMLDMLLVIYSWALLLLVWVVMTLSDEVSDIITPLWITEIVYGVLLGLHLFGVSLIVWYQFMDVEEGHIARGKRKEEEKRAVQKYRHVPW